MVIYDIVKDLAKHATKKYSIRATSFLRGIVVHHSGASGLQNVPAIAAYHVNERGWPGIGYHYVIDDAGTVFKTNYISTLAYHSAGSNKESIGICVLGNFEESDPTSAQLAALTALITAIREVHPTLYVAGHKDKTPTACPGRRLYDWLKQQYPA